MTSRSSDQRYLAASAWLAPGGAVAAVLAAASDASLQLLAFHVSPDRSSVLGYEGVRAVCTSHVP